MVHACALSLGRLRGRACVRTPSRRRSKKKLISSSVYTSGRAPTSPSTCPTSLSARVSVGSTCGATLEQLRRAHTSCRLCQGNRLLWHDEKHNT